MKITRNINGTEVEFELTDIELADAKREYWRNCLKADVKARIQAEMDDPIDEEGTYAFNNVVSVDALRELLNDEERIARIVERIERALDENCCISDCFWQTIDDTIGDDIEEENE